MPSPGLVLSTAEPPQQPNSAVPKLPHFKSAKQNVSWNGAMLLHLDLKEMSKSRVRNQ